MNKTQIPADLLRGDKPKPTAKRLGQSTAVRNGLKKRPVRRNKKRRYQRG